LINVRADGIPDPRMRAAVEAVRPRFFLTRRGTETLMRAGAEALRGSPEYQRLLDDLGVVRP
jgi:hypothetical protein